MKIKHYRDTDTLYILSCAVSRLPKLVTSMKTHFWILMVKAESAALRSSTQANTLQQYRRRADTDAVLITWDPSKDEDWEASSRLNDLLDLKHDDSSAS